jgi:hypothetical protein
MLHLQEAISIADMTENILGAAPLPANEVLERALILPEGKGHTPPLICTSKYVASVKCYLDNTCP